MNRIFGILLVLAAALGFGCSGINASKSISPLDFILPGLMQDMPPTPVIPSVPNVPPELARVSQDLLSLQTQPNSSL